LRMRKREKIRNKSTNSGRKITCHIYSIHLKRKLNSILFKRYVSLIYTLYFVAYITHIMHMLVLKKIFVISTHLFSNTILLTFMRVYVK